MARFEDGFIKGSFDGNTGAKSLLSDGLLARLGVVRDKPAANDHMEHGWITVVDPTKQRSLLQACDHCGVVKSENSVVKECTGTIGANLISSAYLEASLAI